MSTENLIYRKIQDALDDLPGTAAHLEMYPGRKVMPDALKEVTDYRTSAVLALLYEHHGTKIVLTQRQNYRGKHGGQISFPGGKMEQFDQSTLQTALRETHEEIGVKPEEVEVIGKLTDVYIPVSRFLVHPYIGYHQDVPSFKPSEYEVKEVISFDVDQLLDEQNLSHKNIKTSEGLIIKDIPCFILNGRVVWGATALMLNEIKAILKR